MTNTNDVDIVICVGRESIEALSTGEPVRVGNGQYLIQADSYDHPYKRIAALEEAMRAIITSVDGATAMRCLAARALDDPAYWHLYREMAQVDEASDGERT